MGNNMWKYNKKVQAGFSYSGAMFMVCVLAFIIKVLATVAPAYYEYYTITKIIRNMYQEMRMESKSVAEVQSGIDNRFQINNIKRQAKDFEYEKDDKNFRIIVDYEVREKFGGNLDVVMSFKKTFESSSAKSEE